VARRILIYTNHFSPENFKVNEIAETFNDGTNVIKVITCIPNYPSGKIYPGYGFFKKSKERIGGMTVRRLPMIPRGSGSKIRLVLNYISYFTSVFLYTFWLSVKRERYDVVFVHHTSPILIALSPLIYKFFFRKSKMVLWDLDIWPETLEAVGVLKSKRSLAMVESFVRFIYNRYDHILVGSKSFEQIVGDRVKNVPVSYFPNWAEDVFIRRDIIKPDNPVYFPEGMKIMFAGNLGQAQDVQNVFKAAELVRDLNVHWLIVGDGRMKKWFEDEVISNGMQEKVHFYGNNPIRYMPWFFSHADVMLVSLRDEPIFRKTVPAKLQAYMAFEKPVLAMISGEGADIINVSGCGWTAPCGNYVELAEKVKEILNTNSSELLRIAEAGKKYFDAHFRKELRFRQLENIFDS